MQAHRNNVGLLRLVLAGLVIIGHAPEIIDGNRAREPLTMVFRTLSLGELAVDGFFLLSGYLITMSMVRSRGVVDYLWRRLARIVPGFVVAFILTIAVLVPLTGGHPLDQLGAALRRLILLRAPPEYPGALSGLTVKALNGSLWTISYEFRCYVLVALLCVSGALKRPPVILALAAVMVAGSVVATFASLPAANGLTDLLIGDPAQAIRLAAVFMVGTCAYLYWTEIKLRLTGRIAAVATVALVSCMFQPHLAEAAVMTFGAVALFWLALKADLGPLQPINDKWDVSYGVYLYGWPITVAVLWFNRGISPWVLGPVALVLALIAGAASWRWIEKNTKTTPLPSWPTRPPSGKGVRAI